MIHFAGVIFYALFASGDLQPWAEPPEELQETVESKPPEKILETTALTEGPAATNYSSSSNVDFNAAWGTTNQGPGYGSIGDQSAPQTRYGHTHAEYRWNSHLPQNALRTSSSSAQHLNKLWSLTGTGKGSSNF
ncbi:unnamed protein product [Allacma fusca]|uniref:Uncharacterized protein n=1 Tax=Allacma fusca TaxID=39272 RepID=A0A8J2KLP7_9HEXA|nr:unnamed protein product [Allacma fusca]